MIRFLLVGLVLCLPVLLSSCGDLPEPFLGNPGATARRLAQPVTPLLAVPVPPDALLPNAAGAVLADNVATALQMAEVPAIARPAVKTDWRLAIQAHVHGEDVVPRFIVFDPQGVEQGMVEGIPVRAAAWAAGQPATFRTVAADAAPKISATLTAIRIARDKADPNSLYNRPAKVQVAEVTGAPGDGDQALTRQMRSRLATLGPVVLTKPEGADFVVQGQVRAVPIAGHKQRIEIQWIITENGDERGRVVQLNEIPAGTLDRYWGDVAVVVATEAAGGVNDVILRQSGHDPNAGARPVTAAPQGAADAAPQH